MGEAYEKYMQNFDQETSTEERPVGTPKCNRNGSNGWMSEKQGVNLWA
jgi:hypothetical protein